MNDSDIETWCEETLPDIYDEGMFDSEEISEEVWEAVAQAIEPLEDENEDDDTLSDMLTSAARDWFRAHHDMTLELIAPLPEADIATICSRPQTAQHSADWYTQRRNRLTASEFAQILDGRRGALLRQKIAPSSVSEKSFASPVGIAQPDGDMNATTWGHRFEPIVRDIYEQELAGPGVVNDSLGRFTHQRIPWLSASPDGIITKGPLAGRLLEIKAPKTRQPGEFVPVEYFVQMQIQMEVADLDVVDFVEAQFNQRPVSALSAEDKKAIAKAAWKGRIEVRGCIEDSTTWSYNYSKAVEDLGDAVLPESKEPILESTVWWLVGWYPRTVLRNKIWWQSIGWPNAELFWAEVLSLKDSNTISHIEPESWMGSN